MELLIGDRDRDVKEVNFSVGAVKGKLDCIMDTVHEKLQGGEVLLGTQKEK